MTRTENLMLVMDRSGPPTLITGFLEFDRRLDFKRIEQNIKKRLLCFDRFKKRAVPLTGKTGSYRWETDHGFNLGSHLLHPSLTFADSRQLQGYFSKLATAPLDPSKPLWQIHYLEPFENNRSHLFFRVHHCIADGIALVQLLISITDENPDGDIRKLQNTQNHTDPANAASGRLVRNRSPLYAMKRTGDKLYHTGSLTAANMKSILANPARAKNQVTDTTTAVSEISGKIARLLLLPPDRRLFLHPEKTCGKTTENQRNLAWSGLISLDDIKKTGTRFNATVNDIVVSIATGGLRRYLGQHGGLKGKPVIRMVLPVNIRQQEAALELKNEFGFIPITLPVYIKDPARRIHRISTMLDGLKQSPDSIATWIGLGAMGGLPAPVALKTARLFAEKITGTISNVPGPGYPLYFAGGQLRKIMFWVPLIKGLAIGISIISYNNSVSMGVVTDPCIAPEPGLIIQHMEAEYKELLETCNNRQE